MREAVGWKDFSNIDSTIWQTIRIALNRAACFLRLPLVRKSAIIGNRMSLILLALLTALPFEFGAFVSLISSACFAIRGIIVLVVNLVIVFTKCAIVGFEVPGFAESFSMIFWAILFWLMFGTTRIISIELNKTRNQGFIFAMFGAVMAVVAVVVAILISNCGN